MTLPVPLTREQYLMGRDAQYPPIEAVEVEIARLLYRVNRLLAAYGNGPVSITSGYRPGHYNTRAGGAAKSAHLTGEAVDLADSSGDLKKWIASNPNVLVEYNLYMEAPAATPTWCHLQTRATKSGARIFNP